MNSRQLNAARFLGFADAYDKARPACPPQILEIGPAYTAAFRRGRWRTWGAAPGCLP